MKLILMVLSLSVMLVFSLAQFSSLAGEGANDDGYGVEELIQLVVDGDDLQTRKESIRELGELSIEIGEVQPANSLLIEVLREGDRSYEEIYEAFETLRLIGGGAEEGKVANVIASVISTSDDRRAAEMAAATARTFGVEIDVVVKLVESFTSGESDVRLNSIVGIDRLFVDVAVDLPAAVRENFASGIDILESVPVLKDILIEALGDADEAVSVHAIRILGDMGSYAEGAVPALSSVLREGTDKQRLPATVSLGKIGLETVVPALRYAVESGGEDERLAAIEALGRIGTAEAIDFLEDVTGADLDWPMWRYDAARSADPDTLLLSDSLHLQWVRRLPEPRRAWRYQLDDRDKLEFDVSYSPVASDGRLFVPSSVSDSVTAYSIYDGEKLWRFYTDGPVRLAPAVDQDRIYFVSDDGFLYCLNAESGNVIWKFQGGPSDHRLLGNERIINFWPARGAPVIKDGTVYFAAGIWPLHGLFLYALNAESGDLEWVNGTISSDFVRVYRGSVYGRLAPQGYIAVDNDRLIVSGGRGGAAFFNRNTGEFVDDWFDRDRERVQYDEEQATQGGYAVHAVGDRGGMKKLKNRTLQSRVKELEDVIGGEVFYKLAAHGRLIVSTKNGSIYCFGPKEIDAVSYEYVTSDIQPQTDEWKAVAESLLDDLGEDEGSVLMLGAGSGDLLRELLVRGGHHIIVVEENPERVFDLREELVTADMYGRRAAVIQADPSTFSVQPYLFSMVLSENARDAGLIDNFAIEALLDRLRPYGGIAYLGANGADLDAVREAASETDVDRVTIELRDDHLYAKRGGPLTGAGKWTHQYHDSANTLLSQEERVRLPLGLLWFGGPNNHNILPRHTRGPRPQVVGGRQMFLGVETIAARCVYTGRELWEREFPGIGHPFTRLEDEERWEEGHYVYLPNLPGSVYIGSPFVSLEDSIYLRYEGRIYRLDSITGETLDVFTPPGRSAQEVYDDEDVPEWGYISVQRDFLIATSEPHIFEDQKLGRGSSYSGTSSRRIAVMNRYSGEAIWEREARVGFRHNAIVSSEDRLYIIDGLSEEAIEHLARRGEKPEEPSRIFALELETGAVVWSADSKVGGTFLIYSEPYDVLVEGGTHDVRSRGHKERALPDEPRRSAARRGEDGEALWESGLDLPAAVRDDMLISASRHDRRAVSLTEGGAWRRVQPHTGESSTWRYSKSKNCDAFNASVNLLLFRTTYAGFFDLEHDTGTGFFSGFRSGCTANMIAADGVLNALDYTRTCTCPYGHQTSLAMIYMPGDSSIEFWTRGGGTRPDPTNYGLNFGAPGRRVDVAGSERIWFDEPGTMRRHPSAIEDNGGSIDWVVASVKEINGSVEIDDLVNTTYTVRLHFAELDEDVEPGIRVFDVLLNDQEFLIDFDVAEQAGGPLRGTVQEFTVGVEESTLNVKLRKSEGSELEPVISGIELIAEDK